MRMTLHCGCWYARPHSRPDRSWSGARRMASWVWWPPNSLLVAFIASFWGEDPTIQTSPGWSNHDQWRQRQDRRPLSDFIIWLNISDPTKSPPRNVGGVGVGGIDSANDNASLSFGMRSGAALPTPGMAPPRSCCVFSFLHLYKPIGASPRWHFLGGRKGAFWKKGCYAPRATDFREERNPPQAYSIVSINRE